MKTRKRNWLPGFIAIIFLIGIPVWFFTQADDPNLDTPWENMPRRAAHVDHKNLFDGLGELTTGPEVTAACLTCHEDAGEQIIHTAHWRWESDPVKMEGRDELVTIGKNQMYLKK